MIAAVAGIWLWVFVPSLKNRSEIRERRSIDKAAVKDSLVSQRERLNALPRVRFASQAHRARNTQRVSNVLMAMAALTLVWSISVSSEFGSWWIVALASAGAAVLLFAINRLAAKAISRAVSNAKSVRRPSAKFYAPGVVVAIEQEEAEAAIDNRTWSSAGVPSQLYRAVSGTLENPQFAEVLDFAESAKLRADENLDEVQTSSIDIDEILRRRRANG